MSRASATLNFRVDPSIPMMLRQLAEAAGVSMTEYVSTVVRVLFKMRFPRQAEAYETPAERLQREILSIPRKP